MAQQRQGQPSKAEMLKNMSVGGLVQMSKPKKQGVRDISKFAGVLVGAAVGAAFGPIIHLTFLAADFDHFGRSLRNSDGVLDVLICFASLIARIGINLLTLPFAPILGLINGIRAGVKGGILSAINPLAIMERWRKGKEWFAKEIANLDIDQDLGARYHGYQAHGQGHSSLNAEQIVFGLVMTAGIGMGIGIALGANPLAIYGIGNLLSAMLSVVGLSAAAGPVGILAVMGAMTIISFVAYIGLKILKPHIIDKIVEKFGPTPQDNAAGAGANPPGQGGGQQPGQHQQPQPGAGANPPGPGGGGQAPQPAPQPGQQHQPGAGANIGGGLHHVMMEEDDDAVDQMYDLFGDGDPQQAEDVPLVDARGGDFVHPLAPAPAGEGDGRRAGPPNPYGVDVVAYNPGDSNGGG